MKAKARDKLTGSSYRISSKQKKAIKRHAKILKQYESYVVRQAIYLYFHNMGIDV